MFGKELLELARRRGYWLLRLAFALAVLAILWSAWSVHEGAKGLRVLANISSMTFAEIAVTQFIAIHLLTPLVLCGSIADERKAGTLDLLFTTTLTSREIVAGKLASRFFVIGLIVVSGLPALALMSFWGGFTPTMVFGLEIATLFSGLFAGSIAIFYSAICETSLRALVYTYLVLFGLFASVVYWWVSPTFVLILVFGGDNVVPLGWLTFVYAGACVGATFWLTWIIVQRASFRLREPPHLSVRLARRLIDKALEEMPIPAEDEPALAKLRHAQRKIVREIGQIESDAGRFDFSDRPEVGCVAAVAFNFLALALPFFMTGVLLSPEIWLRLLLVGAALIVVWIASQSVYLDRKRGFRDLVLATPMAGDEILRLVLRRWRTNLFWPILCVGVGQALWLIFDPLAALALLTTEGLLAANLIGLSLACMVVAPTRSQAFFAAILGVLFLIVIGTVTQTVRSLQPPWVGYSVAGTATLAIVYISIRGRTARVAARFVVQYAACIAAFVGTWLIWENAKYPLILGEETLDILSPAAWLMAMTPEKAGGGNRTSGLAQLRPAEWSLICLYWAALAVNVWLTWKWLAKDFDRFVERPTQSDGTD